MATPGATRRSIRPPVTRPFCARPSPPPHARSEPSALNGIGRRNAMRTSCVVANGTSNAWRSHSGQNLRGFPGRLGFRGEQRQGDFAEDPVLTTHNRLCRLIWKILRQGIRYEERGPAVSAEAKKVRARKMIRELRSL